MEQLLAHLVGDFLLQPNWLAERKVRSTLWALVHGGLYSLPFLFLQPSWLAFLVIALSHALIDRFRLAYYVARLKNGIWKGDGYPDEMPDYLRFMLTVVADNTIHLVINYFALRYL